MNLVAGILVEAGSLKILLGLASLLWLAGAALLVILQMLPSTGGKAKALWPLLFSQALVLGSIFVLAVLPEPFLAVALLMIFSRIAYEAISVARLDRRHSTLTLMVRLLAFPFLPLVIFCLLWWQTELRSTLVLVILLVEIFDSFSLLGGRLFGRNKLIPTISPNKTFEGLYCGVFALMTLGFALELAAGVNLVSGLLVLAFVAGFAFVGDVAASMQKRAAGVKDFPPVLKIQGGLLDITDSWIAACPMVIAALLVLSYWGVR